VNVRSRLFDKGQALPVIAAIERCGRGPLDKERGRICRKAADYMLPTEDVTRLTQPGTVGAAAATAAGSGKPVRVVLDTNIVLDWLVFADPSATTVGTAIQSGGLTWLTTPRMHAELRAVLSRPLATRWDPARELALTIDLSRLALICAEPTPAGQALTCRDASDQVFIDLAREHGPAILLTRDRALLALRQRAAAFGVVIATAAAWRPTLESAT
jgi:predicted nucleic acid-binding protein